MRSTVLCAMVMSVTLELHVSTGALVFGVVTFVIRLTRKNHGETIENVSRKGKWHTFYSQSILRLLLQWHHPNIKRSLGLNL
ncbi:hypothetical protein IFM89_038057 [Coptis chinensis]|uniref:Uncharacterized protein n=1 Tax=Coptis chinensis TaxID=261450 RepID=A0A835H0D0_9MAGN|nr:hypothetical protein IFM89_038057 [Coptis chinensis]